jgi:diguanylate cyclase (GGDEF)-like protein
MWLPAEDFMPKIPGQVWLVSLAVVVIVITAAAAPNAAFSPAGQVSSTVNQATGPAVIQLAPRVVAGTAAFVTAGLFLLLYFYRRRGFILLWTCGWAVLGASMFLASPTYSEVHIRVMAYGVSQFLGVMASLLFVVSADAYRTHPRVRRQYVMVLVPVLLWFALAPLILGPLAVFAPGHLLIAGTLAAAGIGHLLLLRQVRMLGAAVAGVALLLLATSHAWTALKLTSPDAPGATKLLLTGVVLYLVAAGGMQLMTFEDMTYELRRTNRRLESAQGKLRRMVITDPLTGCRNRRFFDEIIGRELQRHQRHHIPLSLLFVDIDQFKAINDTYGHDAGDQVLKQVAAFLLANIREADYVFRWGGDEFLALMSCSEAEARRRGAALEIAFTSSSETLALPTEVHLSIGCAEVKEEDADVMSLVKIADTRMYEKKRAVRRAAS